MPDGAEPFGQPTETVAPRASSAAEHDDALTARPATLVELFHRFAFMMLLVALAVAVYDVTAAPFDTGASQLTCN